MTSQLCGTAVANGFTRVSPFSKIVAFGYSDGPTTGVVRCAACSEGYRFDLLTTDVDGTYNHASWDRGDELRVYTLSPLPDGAFDRIVAMLSTAEAPKWPVWVPGVNPRVPELDRIIETEIIPILSGAGEPRLIATSGGLLQPIVAIRDHPAGDGRTTSDWFALLGFIADDRIAATT